MPLRKAALILPAVAALMPAAFLYPARAPRAQPPVTDTPDKTRDKEGWRDTRIDLQDYGPFISTAIDTPGGNVDKGVAVRLGQPFAAAVVFDTQALAIRVGWEGAFVTRDPTKFGVVSLPAIAGTVRFVGAAGPGWPGARKLTYRGLRLHGHRVLFEYDVDGRRVTESSNVVREGGRLLFVRTLEIAAGARPLRLAVLGDVGAAAAGGADLQDGRTLLIPQAKTRAVVVLGAREDAAALAAVAARGPEDLTALGRPGPRRWGSPLTTKGQLGSGNGPYVIDTIPVPYDNPHKALMFLSGVGFFRNGDAAVSALHGDVWLVRGIDEKLGELRWQRFATGLYQPLGLQVVEDQVYVLGRDRITRLRDEDGDGEADRYESWSDAIFTDRSRHQFVTSLDVDRGGNFYYVDPYGVHRIDGRTRRHETLATGWRNPNGMSVGPDGTVTVAPQEGNWTPASMIDEVRRGGHYGFGGPKVTKARPSGYDPHLVYIPRFLDNSTGSQVWVTSKRWGPLEGQLLNLSFGLSAVQLVLRHRVDGIPQGAVVPIEGRFLSGIMRGRFHPRDGQLYVVGMSGWQTNAVKDGGFQRMRYTGKPVRLPVASSVHANGLRLSFSTALSRAVAEDVRSWRAEAWNYRYAETYGSREYSVREPDREGHDPVVIRAAHLLSDGKSVFLEMPELRPVHQLMVQATLESGDGAPMPVMVVSTINRLGARFRVPPRRRGAEPSALVRSETGPSAPGLVLALDAPGTTITDARVSRVAALHVPAGTAPSALLPAGPHRAVFSGRLLVAARDKITFSAEGRGRVRLLIDGAPALDAEGERLGDAVGTPRSLEPGEHTLRLEYDSPATGDATVRLRWESSTWTREPVPPTVFRHDAAFPALAEASALRAARASFARHNCVKCHAPEGGPTALAKAMPELAATAPSLREAGKRFGQGWMAAWIANPSAHRTDASMPALTDETGARDIAAYLATLGRGPDRPAKGDPGAGAALFRALGCIGCHTRPDRPAADGRLSLAHVRAKFRPGALAAFLSQPGAYHAWTRMPDFRLSTAEAEALAAFLVSKAPAPAAAPAGDAQRGRALAERLACAACHELPGVQAPTLPPLKAVAALDWSRRGCVAEAGPTGKAPRLAMDDAEKAIVRRLSPGRMDTLFRMDLAEVAGRETAALGCLSCHDRDGEAARWTKLEEETRDLPEPAPSTITIQARPTLTFTGDKLRTPWLARLLDGTLPYRLRPWLHARMPAFGPRGARLARALAAEHGWPADPVIAPATGPHVALGRRLLGVEGGFSCTACHAVGKEPAQAQMHFGAINLVHARERLRDDFYLRWLMDPLRVDPLTPMPAYADREGKTPLAEHLGGDARQQFQAIWEYLATVESSRLVDR